MTELVFLKSNDIFTDSMVIAKGTEYKHHSITRIIRNFKKDFEEFGQVGFKIQSVKYSRGTNNQKIYLLNEPQATFLISLLRNSKIVVAFKKELVKQFYQMRQLLLEKQTPQYLQIREANKEARKAETEAIKKFVQYAQNQGSKNAKRYYISFSNLANKTVGISSKEVATTQQLNNLSFIENLINKLIISGISEEVPYRQIYFNCKNKLNSLENVLL